MQKGPTAKRKKFNFAAKEIKHPETRSDLISMKKRDLSNWIKFQGVVIPKDQSTKNHLLELAEKIWHAVTDGNLLPEGLRIQTSPGTRSDLRLMLAKDLDLWIRSHDIPTGRCVIDNKKELLSLCERIWDAIQTNDFADLRTKLRPDKVKVPRTREDLGLMTGADLRQWIGSQGVCIAKDNRNKDRILALAETTWDAIENDILNDLTMRRRPAPYSVKAFRT